MNLNLPDPQPSSPPRGDTALLVYCHLEQLFRSYRFAVGRINTYVTIIQLGRNAVYEYGEEIGVGLGAPDLMVKRRGQLNHALAMMHEVEYTVPLGIAIQDGNYIGMTGADYAVGEEPEPISKELAEKKINLVPSLHAFAKDFLKVRYMFWVNEEPYFETHVLPCFGHKHN